MENILGRIRRKEENKRKRKIDKYEAQ